MHRRLLFTLILTACGPKTASPPVGATAMMPAPLTAEQMRWTFLRASQGREQKGRRRGCHFLPPHLSAHRTRQRAMAH